MPISSVIPMVHYSDELSDQAKTPWNYFSTYPSPLRGEWYSFNYYIYTMQQSALQTWMWCLRKGVTWVIPESSLVRPAVLTDSRIRPLSALSSRLWPNVNPTYIAVWVSSLNTLTESSQHSHGNFVFTARKFVVKIGDGMSTTQLWPVSRKLQTNTHTPHTPHTRCLCGFMKEILFERFSFQFFYESCKYAMVGV